MGTKHSTLHKSDRKSFMTKNVFWFPPLGNKLWTVGFWAKSSKSMGGDLSSWTKESIRYYYTKITAFKVFFQHFRCRVCVFFFFNSSCLLFVLERTLVFFSCASSDQPLKLCVPLKYWFWTSLSSSSSSAYIKSWTLAASIFYRVHQIHDVSFFTRPYWHLLKSHQYKDQVLPSPGFLAWSWAAAVN